jgi:hypothetical protein
MNRIITGFLAFSIVALGTAGSLAAHPGAVDEDERLGNEPPIRLLLNVPAHRLYVYESGELTRTYRIAVGEPGHETPSGSYRVSNIIWNPWWHPPPSDWARNRTVEPPGPDNPMGKVKMNFGPLLYIHGNPEIELLGRAASKGCIRMSNEEVMELARLVHSYTTPNVGPDVIDRLAGNEQTRTFNISRTIPFRVVYEIAEVRDGYLIIYPDIYDKVGPRFEKEVRQVLAQHGLDWRDVNNEHLDRLLEKGRHAIVSASLAELAGRPVVGASN